MTFDPTLESRSRRLIEKLLTRMELLLVIESKYYCGITHLVKQYWLSKHTSRVYTICYDNTGTK